MCVFTGRLARAPLRRDKADKARCYFTLLDSSPYKKSDGTRDTYAIDFMVQGKRAEAISTYNGVGDLLWVCAKYTPFKRKARDLNGNIIENSMSEDRPLFQVVEYKYLAPGKMKQDVSLDKMYDDEDESMISSSFMGFGDDLSNVNPSLGEEFL